MCWWELRLYISCFQGTHVSFPCYSIFVFRQTYGPALSSISVSPLFGIISNSAGRPGQQVVDFSHHNGLSSSRLQQNNWRFALKMSSQTRRVRFYQKINKHINFLGWQIQASFGQFVILKSFVCKTIKQMTNKQKRLRQRPADDPTGGTSPGT